MKTQRSEMVTRDSILNLLSDAEVASVSTAETAPAISDGDEYLDLEQLDLGVLTAPWDKKPMGHVLPRKAIRKETWQKILRQLAH